LGISRLQKLRQTTFGNSPRRPPQWLNLNQIASTKVGAVQIENTNLSLNVKLLALEFWDEGAIVQRGKMLAEAAAQLYSR
jgi:hypothetical protein